DFLKLKVSQVIAGTCVMFAVLVLVYMYSKIKKEGYTFYKDTEESKLLLAEYDEKMKKSKKVSPDAETEVHILADEFLEDSEESEEVGEHQEAQE
ncbi:MAG: hypothetical protein IKU89_03685, partial [Oscillospiraceae bacterium]|nr:hypothetical protein [Oscillospiraceae bacterium]